MLKVVEELAALLLVDLVRDHNRSRHHIPIVVQNTQVALDARLSVAETLDAVGVFEHLCLKDGLSALINTLKDDDVSGVHDARVVDRHVRSIPI